MKIQQLMIPDPITISEKGTIYEALDIMKTNSIRHLPVVSKKKELKGFITLADLKQGLIPSMLGDLSLSDLMIKSPITITPDQDIEIAAQLIYKHKIGGIPVVRAKKLVGIITETDILRTFINMMGILASSSRIDVLVGDKPGAFREVLDTINSHGGDVINVGMTAQKTSERIYYFRLSPCKTNKIKTALEKKKFKVLDAMD